MLRRGDVAIWCARYGPAWVGATDATAFDLAPFSPADLEAAWRHWLLLVMMPLGFFRVTPVYF